MLSPGTYGHGGAWGTQAWIDPVKGVAYVLMVQRSNFPNSDASDVRRAFQQAAAQGARHELSGRCDAPDDCSEDCDRALVTVGPGMLPAGHSAKRPHHQPRWDRGPLVGSLRAQGKSVSVGDETSPQRNGYFSVPSRDVLVGWARLKAFEDHTAEKADADAALISAEGQPNPRAAIGWMQRPTSTNRDN